MKNYNIIRKREFDVPTEFAIVFSTDNFMQAKIIKNYLQKNAGNYGYITDNYQIIYKLDLTTDNNIKKADREKLFTIINEKYF